MAGLKQTIGVEQKHILSNTLRNWLPILHSSLNELDDVIIPFIESNPIVEVESGFEKKLPNKIYNKSSSYIQNSRTEQIEALVTQNRSLYDILDEQIDSLLFPTPLSKKVAFFVISNLDENGYYEGDSDRYCSEHNLTIYEFENIRLRFSQIEPVGVGAKDLTEAFLFQLDSSDITDEAYHLATLIIKDLKSIYTFSKEKNFTEAMRVIKSFKNPPIIDYIEDSIQVIPDLMIYFDENGSIEVRLNDSYYPTIHIDKDYAIEHEFITKKIKEAKSLVDALEMRRATLYKVGLMIVEYQYDFFMGGNIMPLTLKILADEFGHNPSTISRAIANKYIACDRGVFAMKDFFTTAIDEDVSNSSIKDFLVELVKNENKQKPLSDMKFLSIIQEKFKIKMVRRTITKYRKQLNIASSSERKKLYKMGL